MKIQYYNVFLCENGKKTDYSLANLIDYLSDKSSQERTVNLGSQNILFLKSIRDGSKYGSNGDGSTLENHEYLPQNRSFWIGKYRSEKPYEGKIGDEELKQIDGDLFEPNMCLLIPTSHLFLMERKFLGPTINQVKEFFESFISSTNATLTIQFEPITRESLRKLIPASDSIKSVTLTVRNEGFQLSNLFPNIKAQEKTLLEKLLGNLVEVSNDLDINTTTVEFKKGRFKREMNISKIDKILQLMDTSNQNLKHAKVKFKNPQTHALEEIDLKFDGYHVTEKTTDNYAGFDKLANLMTEHYYEDRNADKNNEYLKFGHLLSLNGENLNLKVSEII